MSEEGVHVLNILGQDYSIRATDSEGAVLAAAEKLLQKQLLESQRHFPKARSNELLVLAALNLCVPLLKQGEQLEAVQQRLAASVERITRQLQA
jgi:cell division protein ZapA